MSAIQVETVPREARFRPVRLPWQRRNALEEFVALPRTALPPDSLRTPLLDLEQADLVDRQNHPFYRADGDVPAAQAELFLARRDGRPVGRIAAILNHNHNLVESAKAGTMVRTGYFGFYEAIPDRAVADGLLRAAAEWLRGRGMDEMIGPASPSHNYYYGSRAISEEPGPPTASRFLEAYNPDYYNDQYAAWGLKCVRRLLGYEVDLAGPEMERARVRFGRTIEQLVASTGMVIRGLDLEDFDAEIGRASELINRSLAENWGFSPMTRVELGYMAKQMRWLIDPELVLFVELGGEPVGISLAIPDYNQLFAAMGGSLGGWAAVLRFANLPLVRSLWPRGNAWATERIGIARVIALGVLPSVSRHAQTVRREMLRLGPALIYATTENIRRAGYGSFAASWILEDNRAMNAPFRILGTEPKRVWKIWGREL